MTANTPTPRTEAQLWMKIAKDKADEITELKDIVSKLEEENAALTRSLRSTQDLLTAAERRWQRDIELVKHGFYNPINGG